MTITQRSVSILLSAVLALTQFPGTARAGELDVRMAKIVKTFSRAAAEAGLSEATLAVLPFRTDSKLAEKRVDYACAEILANRLVEAKTFKVTERARLEEIMREQRLGLSGAVESATAAKVGKLSGARLVILGSVSRLGANYHLSTEMVDSETGEIMASDVTEVAVEVFDKDAARFITEVPEYDALGLYLAGGAGPVAYKKPPLVTNASLGGALNPVKTDISYGYLGVGLRYKFSPKWMLDAAYFPSVVFGGSDGTIATGLHPANTAPMTNVNNPESYETTMFRLLMARTLKVSRVFSAQAAVGLTQFPQFKADAVYVDNAGGSTPVTIRTSNSRTVLTTLRLGLEWKPRPRFGWSVSALYYLGKMTARTTATFPDRGTAVIQKYETRPFAAETNLSVYF